MGHSTYTIGKYDSREKVFVGTVESIPETASLLEETLTGDLVGKKVGVMQVITFANNNIVKSAVKVVTVK